MSIYKLRDRKLIMVMLMAMSLVTLRRYVGWSIGSTNLMVSPISEKMDAGRDDEPFLVFHIGPHKTATSTTQCDLSYHRDLLYEKASVAYLGRRYYKLCENKEAATNMPAINTRDLLECLEEHSLNKPCNQQKIWVKFENILERLSGENITVIISDEAFSRMKSTPKNMRLLHSTLNKFYPGQVRISLVYRRYFEYILSVHNEVYKPLGRRDTKVWPSEGHRGYIHPFVTFYEMFEKQHFFGLAEKKGEKYFPYMQQAALQHVHPVEYLQHFWSDSSNAVQIFNMHVVRDDMSTSYVESILPRGKANVFQQGKMEVKLRNKTKPSRSNPSLNLDFDRLAVTAKEIGLFDSTEWGRREVAKATEKLFQKLKVENNMTLEDFPQVCLNETQLKDFLRYSLDVEQHLFFPNHGQRAQQNDEEAKIHESDFYRAVQRGKFCNMDVTKVIEMPLVRKFYESLN